MPHCILLVRQDLLVVLLWYHSDKSKVRTPDPLCPKPRAKEPCTPPLLPNVNVRAGSIGMRLLVEFWEGWGWLGCGCSSARAHHNAGLLFAVQSINRWYSTCHPSHMCLSNIHPLSSKSYLQKLTLISVIHAKSGNISNKSQWWLKNCHFWVMSKHYTVCRKCLCIRISKKSSF